jgi:hypothetical protein
MIFSPYHIQEIWATEVRRLWAAMLAFGLVFLLYLVWPG